MIAEFVLVAVAAQVMSAPTSVRLAPAITEQSQIWLDPALPGTGEDQTLRRFGYIREEWFQSGTAHVYARVPGGGINVEVDGLPYTTRLIVIRPRSPSRFSGTVHLNPAHPMLGNFNWRTIARYVVERGDAYVTVMIGADANTRRAPPGPVPAMATTVLKWFDPVRYAPIQWPDNEDGIRWDVFAETARLLRAGTGPLRGLPVKRVYASGWSFTGSFLRTFINEGFHDRTRTAQGKPLIDGYLLGISSFSFRSGYLPINSRAPVPPIDDPRRPNLPIDVPVIELMSENEAVTNREPQTFDRDSAPGAHRLYEVPGVTHSSGGDPYRGTQLQIERRLAIRQAAPADPCPFPMTDIDIGAFARAAHDNLDRWVRNGMPPPRAVRLQHVAGQPRRDADGNTLGGIRPAQLSVPLARYGAAPKVAACDRDHNGIGSPMLPMRRIFLSPERLRELYPNGASEYLRRFDAAVNALVKERWLRLPDARRQKAEARRFARQAFRQTGA